MTVQDRRNQHVALRQVEQMKLKKDRAKLTWGRRVDEAMLRARYQGNIGGRAWDRDKITVGKSDGGVPTGGGDPDVDKFVRRIEVAVQALENRLDAYAVRPVSADYAGEHAEDRDRRLVRDFAGYEPGEVVDVDPSFGSVRAVERARVRMGVDPFSGR